MRRLGSIASLIILLCGNFSVAPANSLTVKNGVNCSKKGANLKVGSKVYRCAKNPYVKPTRLTWTLTGCLTANALLKDARQQYSDWESLAKLAGPEGQKTLDDLQISISSLEKTMQEIVCKRGA